MQCKSHYYINAFMWSMFFLYMKYGILLTTFTLSDGSVHCLVQGFHELTLPDRQLVNEYDCPLMDLSTTILTYLPLSSALLATIYNNLCLLFISALVLAYSKRLGHQSGMLSVKLFRTHLYLSMTGTKL